MCDGAAVVEGGQSTDHSRDVDTRTQEPPLGQLKAVTTVFPQNNEAHTDIVRAVTGGEF